MNVFGVGPLELTLVVVIAVIVLGPERIPEVAVQVARVIRSLRGYATDATADMRRELDELTKDYEDVRKELKQVRDSLTGEVKSVSDEVSKALEEPIVEASGDSPPGRRNGAVAEVPGEKSTESADDARR